MVRSRTHKSETKELKYIDGLIVKLEGEMSLGRPRRRWKVIFEIPLKERWCEDMGCIHLA
jgi:hypothetical protein